mgnify:CR=1 FL=1
MKNIELNLGGLLGGVMCFFWGVALSMILVPNNENASEFGEVIVFAVIAGAFTGNFLWDRIFKKFK